MSVTVCPTDCIEGNVEKAYGNVESGTEQLTQASKYQVSVPKDYRV